MTDDPINFQALVRDYGWEVAERAHAEWLRAWRHNHTSCAICKSQSGLLGGHWAWHRFCRGELNPVALIGWAERSLPPKEAKKLVDMVVLVTGMDERAARAALAKEQNNGRADRRAP